MQVPSDNCKPFQQLEPAQQMEHGTYGMAPCASFAHSALRDNFSIPEDSSDSYLVVLMNSRSLSPTTGSSHVHDKRVSSWQCKSGTVTLTKATSRVIGPCERGFSAQASNQRLSRVQNSMARDPQNASELT